MKDELAGHAPMCSIAVGRWHLTFRLRTLLLFVFVCSLLIGALIVRLGNKRTEERLARRILAAGGTVCYNYEWTPGVSYANEAAEPYGPRWLRWVLGDDFFSRVVFVGFKFAQDNDLSEIRRLNGLQFLGLSNSPITNSGLAQIAGLTNIEELYLAATSIDNRGLAFLKGLHNLKLLVLDDTHIGDEGLAHLQNLKHLSYLSLDGTRITDAGVANLKWIDSLQDLRLADNNLTDATLVHLKSMHNLKTLSLVGNKQITASAIDRLKVELPHTEITWKGETGKSSDSTKERSSWSEKGTSKAPVKTGRE